jgi:hypothetical protein
LIAAVVRLAFDTADSVATIAAPIAAQLRAALADSSFLSQAQNAPQKLALAHVFELLRGVARHLGRPARRTPGSMHSSSKRWQSHLPACSGALIRATG